MSRTFYLFIAQLIELHEPLSQAFHNLHNIFAG